MDIKTTILLFALVCALAAFFVMWAKREQEKLKTREERENYQAALRIGNANAEYSQRLEAEVKILNLAIDSEVEFADNLIDEKRAAQDRLSALLCPMNDHVWKDGRCVKCGRMKDAAD